jgi:hypothetical protein
MHISGRRATYRMAMHTGRITRSLAGDLTTPPGERSLGDAHRLHQEDAWLAI